MKRFLFVLAGHVFFALGVIGLFVPLMPTTPFLLLAAWCYSRGSERIHRWLLGHPRFGAPIIDWMDHGVIRRRAKFVSIVLIACSLAYPLLFLHFHVGLKLAALAVALAVMAFIATRPESPRG